MEKQITDILRNLMACASVTNTEKETVAETWMLDFLENSHTFKRIRNGAGCSPYRATRCTGIPYGRW